MCIRDRVDIGVLWLNAHVIGGHVVQDPVARAFEQFQALHRGAAKCAATHPRNPQVCPKPPLFERAVVTEAPSGGTQRGCFFDTPVRCELVGVCILFGEYGATVASSSMHSAWTSD